jgi:predicted amidophosphoribosyltransferase
MVHKECLCTLRQQGIKSTFCTKCKKNLLTPTYYSDLCERCSETFTMCIICGSIIDDPKRNRVNNFDGG